MHVSAPSDSYKLVVSVYLDEWFHSRRWTEGVQTRSIPDTKALCRAVYGTDRPAGDLIPPTKALLSLFRRHRVRCTFFVLGEVAEWYPDLVREIADGGHEIGCHGLHHVDMTVLGPDEFSAHLERAIAVLIDITGQRPVGYRAPNLVYEPWATRVLEQRGFVYDTTVCVSRPVGGKYRGWARASHHPYHPSYEDIAKPGTARLVELPLPSFPVIKLSAGSGIFTRVLGFHWTFTTLRYRIRTGDTGFYFHPWEVAPIPQAAGRGWRQSVFYRHTGQWMLDAVDRILAHFSGRVVTGRQAAEALLLSSLEPQG
jgi:peptidoglycan/xylan/chitin deacetylase (PgdA/CDA1 family)